VSRGTVPDGRFAAVDLGASSGRVVVGEIGPHRVELTEVHRFANRPVQLPTGLHWDVLGLHGELLDGLAAAARGGALDSIGVDSWAVDYGLLDRTGALLGNPYHYRDPRTDGVADQVHNQRPFAQLYLENGLQFLPFTTLYQLVAAAGTPQLELARTLLLVPDLVVHWLTGTVATEVTNASTTGLLDVRTHTWSAALCELAGVRPPLMAPLVAPGDPLGRLLPAVTTATGLDPATPVTAVGSHDTASAVVAVPMADEAAAYISLGTWGLVGVELGSPVLTEAGRRAGFTNELGVDGRTRYLRNVMGLWLLQECVRVWRAAGRPSDLPVLLEQAAALPPGGPLVDVADPRFLPPGDMPSRIAACLQETGAPPLPDQVHVVRCIVDSLAQALAAAVRDAGRLSGRRLEVVHVVGGGSMNALLCQSTADAAELPVVAGPVEATALGNLLVQARAHGAVTGDLDVLRALVRSTQALRRFEPRAASGTGQA
jgi:rhamnulokinase